MKTLVGLVAALMLCACGYQTDHHVVRSQATDSVPENLPVTPKDIHGGMVFEADGIIYWVGDSYGCGFVLIQPGNRYCGEVGYSAPSINGPWYGPTQLFDPAPWQSRCAYPMYGCFRPHITWDIDTQDWRMWLNVGSSWVGAAHDGGYAVFKANQPLGPYTYIGDAQNLFPAKAYGDETIYSDSSGNYAVYTIVNRSFTPNNNEHNIAIQRIDPTLQFGVGNAVVLPVNQWLESPTLFERNKLYYVAYSDPTCAFCPATGTSYAVGPTPLGPFSEIRHNITTTSCNGQPASINYVDGEYLYQSDLWTGSFDETNAIQWWEPLTFVGKDIAPITCKTNMEG